MADPTMSPRATFLILALAGCGDSMAPIGGQPTLLTVNGASYPIVAPGETSAWGGFGFGAEQGDRLVLVTTASGTAPAEVVEWTNTSILARIPAAAVTGATVVVAGADTLGPISLLVRPPTPFDPGAWAWTEAATLPEGRAGAAGIALHFPTGGVLASQVVLFGGRRPDGSLSDSTHLGQVDAEGRITAWVGAPDSVAPLARFDHAYAGADRTTARVFLASIENGGVAYVIGGRDLQGGVLADVRGLGVGADGAYTHWSLMTPLPVAVAGASAVVAHGTVFVVGGYGADSVASREFHYALVDSTGTLNGWFAGPELPEGRAFAAAAVSGSTLLLIGGERGVIDPAGVTDTAALAGTVYGIRLSPHTGTVVDSAWVALPTALLHPRSRHASVVVGDALVATGGVYAGVPGSGEAEFAALAADGTLGVFQELPPPTLASLAGGPFWSAAALRARSAQGVPRIALLGGATPSGPSARTWSQ